MFFKRHKPLVILSVTLVVLSIFVLYYQQIKREKLKNELSQVELLSVRIGAGTSKGKLGTAIFGNIVNKGKQTIKIAVMSVDFFNDEGEISKVHKFYPVNNYSFSDSSALNSGNSKEFGFPIDEIVPEDWDGTFTAKLVDLKFK
ncbi:MAG: DUF2393 family protein [SAR324 cluster bacterium]|nr:DUF2393 family protein [SAR324 cluster bacterium]MBL7034103.1 DUF2393 family protein [SAR324 cluster bacterium]